MSSATLLIALCIELVIITGFLLFFRHKVHWQILGENKTSHRKLHGYYVRYGAMLLVATVLCIVLLSLDV